MPDPSERHADPRDVSALLNAVDTLTDLSDRIDAISEQLLGRPYLAFSLIGGPAEPEQLVTRLDGFDCVTFAESVYALATSARAEDVPERLRALRYDRGRCDWAHRNHFMNRWIARNQAAGRLIPVLMDLEIATGEVRMLEALPGYPAQRWPVRFVPSTALDALGRAVRPGDLVAFVSNRPDLDTFHVGLLLPGAPVDVRHAGRSAGHVVQEPLAGFLDRNNVPGMLLARPIWPPAMSVAARGSE